LDLIARDFGSIPKPTRVLPTRYTVEPVQEGERDATVRRVGDVQIIMVAYHAPGGAHPDFVPLQLASSALADEPSGRLYKALVAQKLASDVRVNPLPPPDPRAVVL